LGRGSFGEVLPARWHGVDVVVKRLLRHGQTDEEARLAFRREASLLARVSRHPRVITYLGICATENEWLLVMERAPNGNLQDLLQKQHRLSRVSELDQIIQILVDVSAGLIHLHSSNPPVIHRDIACRNVLLSEDLRGLVSDFGMGRLLLSEADDAKTNTLLGPVRWMAPESFRGTYSTHSDVYMFGMMVWEAFARKPPFHSLPNELVGGAVVRGERPPRLPDNVCPRALAELMERCWVADPLQRPTMKQVHIELERVLGEVRAHSQAAAAAGNIDSFMPGFGSGHDPELVRLIKRLLHPGSREP
jgi:serine/threonine protein kinase